MPASILEVGLTFLGVGSLDDPPSGSVNCALAQLTKTVASASATNNLFIKTPTESLLPGWWQFSQMDSDVLAFIIVDLNRDLGLGLAFGHLDVSLDDVFVRTRRNALCELTTVIGDKFPFRLFVGGAADLDGNPRCRSIIRSPNGADD